MTPRNWQEGIICALMVLLFASTACIAEQRNDAMNADTEKQYSAAEQSAHKTVTITFMSVATPPDRILLIRNGKDVCAVRFTEFHRGRDAKPPTTFHSGDETLYAEYDWYYQGDGSGDFAKPNVESGHSKLERGPMVGIGRFSWQLGATAVACGPFSLRWTYPNHVGFHLSNSKKGDVGNELSPTRWQEIREVNIQDSRLTWYQFDEKRKVVVIPADELW